MKLFVIFGSFLIFVTAIVHLYWSLGGQGFIDKAVPERPDGKKLFKPSRSGTAIVGITLVAVAASVYAPFAVSDARLLNIANIICILFCGIFFVRFIGDFRYAGVFRKVRNTVFAEYDVLAYTPMSLIFSMACGFSAYLFN